jgi:hypothetical protein
MASHISTGQLHCSGEKAEAEERAQTVSQPRKLGKEPQEANPSRGQGTISKRASWMTRRYWRAGTQRRWATGQTQRERERLGKEEEAKEGRHNGADDRATTNEDNLVRLRKPITSQRCVRAQIRA